MDDVIRILNLAMLVALSATAVVLIVVTSRRPVAPAARTRRFAQWTGLPLATESMEQSIGRRLRTQQSANMWGALAAIGAVGIVFLTTPLATSPFLLWIGAVGIYVGGGVAGVVVSVRERVFSPAPSAVRIARDRALRTRDYIGPIRLVVAFFPWWAIPILQLIYLLGGTHLPRALRPAGMREPQAPLGFPA